MAWGDALVLGKDSVRAGASIASGGQQRDWIAALTKRGYAGDLKEIELQWSAGYLACTEAARSEWPETSAARASA